MGRATNRRHWALAASLLGFVGLLGLGQLVQGRPVGKGWLKLGIGYILAGLVLVAIAYTVGFVAWALFSPHVIVTLPIVLWGAAVVPAVDAWRPGRTPPRVVVHLVNLVAPGTCLLWGRPDRDTMVLAGALMLFGAATLGIVGIWADFLTSSFGIPKTWTNLIPGTLA